MNHETADFMPQRKDTLMRELGGELFIYEKSSNTAHCLNPTAADIWKLCNGERNVGQIRRALEEQSKSPIEESLVWVALRQFEKAGLLLNALPTSVERKLVSRRALVHSMGVAAALAFPLVTSVVVPTPAEAVSCAPFGQSCASKPCCAGLICAVNLICV